MGAHGEPKMGHVIDKISFYKCVVMIFENFIFRSIQADFRSGIISVFAGFCRIKVNQLDKVQLCEL